MYGRTLGALLLALPVLSHAQPAAPAAPAAPKDDRPAQPAVSPLPEGTEPPAVAVASAAPGGLAAASASVVRVACRGLVGVGAVFRDRRHVLTSAGLLWPGREVEVTFDQDHRMIGEAVSIDHERGLALVQLPSDAPVPPLALASRPTRPGEAVTVIARGALAVVQVQARVAGEGEGVTFLDGRLSEAELGAPVLDAEGRLVAVVTGVSEGPVPATPMIEAGKSPEAKPVELPPGGVSSWAFAPRSGLMVGVSTEQTVMWGLYSGLRAIGWDRVHVDLSVSIMFDDGLPADDDQRLSRERFGLGLDATAAWRFALMPPDLPSLYLTVGGGVTHQQHGGNDRRLGADGAVERVEATKKFTRPVGEVGLLLFGGIELKYTMDLDLDVVGDSSHRIGFGVAF